MDRSFDPDDPAFLPPGDMPARIADGLRAATGQPSPATAAGARPLHPRQPRRGLRRGRPRRRPAVRADGRRRPPRRRRRPQRAALPADRGRLRAARAGRTGRGDRARQRPRPGARRGLLAGDLETLRGARPGDPGHPTLRAADDRRSAAPRRRWPGLSDARRAVHHLLQRPPLPGGRAGHRAPAASGSASRSSSRPPRPAAARCTSTPATRTPASRWSSASSTRSRATTWWSRRRRRAPRWSAATTRSWPSWPRDAALGRRPRRDGLAAGPTS